MWKRAKWIARDEEYNNFNYKLPCWLHCKSRHF